MPNIHGPYGSRSTRIRPMSSSVSASRVTVRVPAVLVTASRSTGAVAALDDLDRRVDRQLPAGYVAPPQRCQLGPASAGDRGQPKREAGGGSNVVAAAITARTSSGDIAVRCCVRVVRSRADARRRSC